MSKAIVIGWGYSSKATINDATKLFKRFIDQHTRPQERYFAFAAHKKNNSFPHKLSQKCHIPLIWIHEDDLKNMQEYCLSPSNIVKKYMHYPSISEACALAPFKGNGDLIINKQKLGGVTCAAAKGELF